MSKLIRFELHKLFRQKSFYICTAVLLAVNLYSIIFTYDNGGRSTGLVCLSTAVCSADFTMLLGIFVALFTCDDYAGGTIRNIISRGFTRTQVYFSKLIALCIAPVLMVLLNWALNYAAGSLYWETGLDAFETDLLYVLGVQLLLVIAEAALFYAISSAIGKTGASVAVCMLLELIVALAIGIVMLIFEPETMYLDYWLSELRASCCGLSCDGETLRTGFIGALAYFFGSTALGCLSVFKREY